MAITYSESVDNLDQIAAGYTSSVYRVPLEHQILKVIDKEWEKPERRDELYTKELTAYQRMSTRNNRPTSILKFFGPHPNIERGILLELAERGNLYHYLHEIHSNDSPPEPFILLRWAEQLTEALKFVHSCNILHCDIHTLNCFLDEDLNLKLGDFGACAIDGGQPSLMYRATHQLWLFDDVKNKWTRPCSIQSEIFALGCTMYHMEAGVDALKEYEEKSDDLTKKLQMKEMPTLEKVPRLGRFIDKCWELQYASMSDVLGDIRTELQRPRP